MPLTYVNPVGVSPGASGQVLTTDATGAVLWKDAAASGATGAGTDRAFVQNDTDIASDWTIGQDRMTSGVLVSIASPAVFTLADHGFIAGRQVRLATTGTLPTGLASTNYYVVSTGLTGSTFQLSATRGGAAVNASGTQSGVHSVGRCTNANSTGPITVLDGVTVTVPDGCVWAIAG